MTICFLLVIWLMGQVRVVLAVAVLLLTMMNLSYARIFVRQALRPGDAT